MKQIRKRLTYANVMSSIAVFLILGGATAVAAKKIGTKQIKANSITTGKIKKNAVTKAKIKNGAVDGSKIADGSVTGADISAASTPFSQVVAESRGTVQVPFTAGTVYPLNNPTYTQAAGRDDQYISAVDVTFAASCNQPRSATAFLLVDAANPASPTINDLAGFGTVTDNGAGSVNKRIELTSFTGGAGMAKFAPSANTQHTFSVFLSNATCNSGSGITATGAGVDVIGTN